MGAVTLKVYERGQVGPQIAMRCGYAHLRDACLVYVLLREPGVVHYLPVHLFTGPFTITPDPEGGDDASNNG